MEEKNIVMPVVALRGLTVLPGMTIHFDVSREKSVKAAEKAMAERVVEACQNLGSAGTSLKK